MRRYLAYAFAAALAAAISASAVAQDAPPAPDAATVTQGWVDPQAPFYPSPLPPQQVDAGAPFARPLPPEALAPYAYRYTANPCGCPGYAFPAVSWVPVPIQTRYLYSAPIRHESEVVEEKIVEEQVAPPVRARPNRAPARSPRHAKSKVVRTTR